MWMCFREDQGIDVYIDFNLENRCLMIDRHCYRSKYDKATSLGILLNWLSELGAIVPGCKGGVYHEETEPGQALQMVIDGIVLWYAQDSVEAVMQKIRECSKTADKAIYEPGDTENETT